jgi:hypothetical protein
MVMMLNKTTVVAGARRKENQIKQKLFAEKEHENT